MLRWIKAFIIIIIIIIIFFLSLHYYSANQLSVKNRANKIDLKGVAGSKKIFLVQKQLVDFVNVMNLSSPEMAKSVVIDVEKQILRRKLKENFIPRLCWAKRKVL